MDNVDLFAMRQIGKAIKTLDAFRVSVEYVGTQENVKRIDESRNNLINVLFSNGYELELYTYKVVRSKQTRDLI